MSAWLDAAGARGPLAGPAARAGRDAREALQALGYVGGGRPPRRAAVTLPDPKDKLAVYEAYRQRQPPAPGHATTRPWRRCERVLADSPGMLDAWRGCSG